MDYNYISKTNNALIKQLLKDFGFQFKYDIANSYSTIEVWEKYLHPFSLYIGYSLNYIRISKDNGSRTQYYLSSIDDLEAFLLNTYSCKSTLN